MRIVAFTREVELGVNADPRLGVLVRNATHEHVLASADFTALWQASRAQRRHDVPVMPSTETFRRLQQLVSATVLAELELPYVAVGHEDRVALADGVHARLVAPEAVVVRAGRNGLGYLFSSDEADALMRCREPRDVAELVAELAVASQEEERWLLDLLSRACAAQLLALSAPLARFSELDEDNTALSAMEDFMSVVEMEDPRGLGFVAPNGDATPSGAGEVFTSAPPRPMPRWSGEPPRGAPLPAATRPSAPALARPSAPVLAPMHAPESAPPFATRPSVPSIAGARELDGRPTMRPDEMEARLASLSMSADVAPSSPRRAAGPTSWPRLPWILLGVAILAGAYPWITSRGRSEDARSTQPTTGSAAAGASSPSPGGLLASGFIAARTPIVLGAPPGSRIQTVSVDSGDRITKGQVVAMLDSGQLQAELRLARARVGDASRLYRRMVTLVRAQAATPTERDKAQGAYDIAIAEMHVIQQRLEDAKIKSPINATVLEVLAHPGELLAPNPGQIVGVLRIADLSTLVAEVNVNEIDLKQVFIGQEAQLIMDAQRDQKHRGVVREIAEQADRAKGTVLVKVDIEATPDGALKPGMAIQVQLAPKPSASTE